MIDSEIFQFISENHQIIINLIPVSIFISKITLCISIFGVHFVTLNFYLFFITTRISYKCMTEKYSIQF